MLNESMEALNEYQRVKKLHELDLDYAELQNEFYRLVQLAAYITDTDISFVNLIDNYSQWSVTSSAEEPFHTDREDSICQYTILDDTFLEVPHLDEDKRFRDKPFIQKSNFKYYLGVPLQVETGERIGALCVLDHTEKNISSEKKQLLRMIADEIVEKLEDKNKMYHLEHQLSDAIKERYQMAHDIRSPLGGILGLTATVEEESMDAEESKVYFKMINGSVSKLMDLTEDILDKRQKIKEKNNFRLSILQGHLKSLYLIPARNKDIELNISFEKTKDQYKFSRRKLLPIIGNLIANAIKFTPPQGEISVALDITEIDGTNFLHVKVVDNGVGMSKEKLEDLTNETLRLNQGTHGEKGYGLGLQLVTDMVNSINGKLTISSEKGKGTSVEVLIPI